MARTPERGRAFGGMSMTIDYLARFLAAHPFVSIRATSPGAGLGFEIRAFNGVWRRTTGPTLEDALLDTLRGLDAAWVAANPC